MLCDFYIKIDISTKSRYVASRYLTDPPSPMTYVGVVGRENVHIAFRISTLDELDVLDGDIQNAYLNTPTKEKLYFYTGDECKSDLDKIVLIVREFYGLQSSNLMWRNHLIDIFGNKLGCKSSLKDPDVWYISATDETGFEYYTFIL